MTNWQEISRGRRAPKELRTSRDGVVFDSKTELDRWEYLRLLEKAGQIRLLKRQERMALVDRVGEGFIKIMAGKQVAVYTPDFVYEERHEDGPITRWKQVVEDVKAYRDESSKFRIRVFEALYDINVRIIMKKKGRWVQE